MIGVYDKTSNSVVLRRAPAYVMQQVVKSHQAFNPAAVSNTQRLQARNALGETFGTKKAKAAIRAAERNKVDVSAMEGVVGHLQDSIEANTTSLPTNGVSLPTLNITNLIGLSTLRTSKGLSRLQSTHSPVQHRRKITVRSVSFSQDALHLEFYINHP